jgi:hypothetical protein
MPDIAFLDVPLADRLHQGEQVRGFGFLHDGGIATAFDFLHATVFFLEPGAREAIEQFVLAFDTTFAPIVGQQVTLRADNAALAAPRLDLLVARARTSFALVDAPGAMECDLVAKAVVAGEARGYLLDAATGMFRSDRLGEGELSDAALRALATGGQTVTYTCVPPGSGVRVGLDRDEDGFLDRDELDAGTDPADPASFPNGSPTPTVSSTHTPPPTATAPPTAPMSPTALACDGDCDGNGSVTIDELVRGIAIALAQRPVSSCLSMDQNADGEITVDELIHAVNRALDGCAA